MDKASRTSNLHKGEGCAEMCFPFNRCVRTAAYRLSTSVGRVMDESDGKIVPKLKENRSLTRYLVKKDESASPRALPRQARFWD